MNLLDVLFCLMLCAFVFAWPLLLAGYLLRMSVPLIHGCQDLPPHQRLAVTFTCLLAVIALPLVFVFLSFGAIVATR